MMLVGVAMDRDRDVDGCDGGGIDQVEEGGRGGKQAMARMGA